MFEFEGVTKPEMQSVMVLSTGHISMRESEQLEGKHPEIFRDFTDFKAPAIGGQYGPHGWQFRVPEDYRMDRLDTHWPTLKACFEYARKQGAEYLRLDWGAWPIRALPDIGSSVMNETGQTSPSRPSRPPVHKGHSEGGFTRIVGYSPTASR